MVVPPEFLKKFTKRLGVSESELEVLLDTLEGEDLNTIAQKLGIQRNALQKRLGEVYKKFRIEGSGPGKFAKLQKILLEEYQKQLNDLKTANQKTSAIEWKEAPVVGTFFDRASALTQVQDWLTKERLPLMAILGMGGVGKSVFAVKVVESIAQHYDYILWRNLSLHSLPSLSTLITDLITHFRSSQEIENNPENPSLIADLIEHLRRDRCLIILDNYETLFQPKNFAGYYQSGYENYRELFKQITQTRHQSNLLLISRETPLELMSLMGNNVASGMITLKGLTENGIKELLTEKGIEDIDRNTISQLIKNYSGHPVAINQLAITSQTLFNGNLNDLLQQNTIFVGEIISSYFSEQIERLSPLEKEIIEHLALASEGLTLTEIQNHLSASHDLSHIMTALSSLNRRCLLEKLNNNDKITQFTLMPMLKKYLTLSLSPPPPSQER